MAMNTSRISISPDETAVFFFPKVLQQTRIVKLAIIAIHAGNLSFKVGLVTLLKTTHHEQFAKLSFFLPLHKFQDGIDAFLLGISDETAGIDNRNLTLGPHGVMGAMVAVTLHQTHQPLGVHQILGTSQRDNIYLVLLQVYLNKESTNSRLLNS